jgi:hypothetical protein
MNIGEAVSIFPGHKRTPSCIAEHFRSFYLGFTPESIIWFAYRDDDTYFETTSTLMTSIKTMKTGLLLWR